MFFNLISLSINIIRFLFNIYFWNNNRVFINSFAALFGFTVYLYKEKVKIEEVLLASHITGVGNYQTLILVWLFQYLYSIISPFMLSVAVSIIAT